MRSFWILVSCKDTMWEEVDAISGVYMRTGGCRQEGWWHCGVEGISARPVALVLA